MSYQRGYDPYNPYGSRPERRWGPWFGCLVSLVVLVFLLLLGAVALLVFVRPQVSKLTGQAIGSQLEQQIRGKISEQAGTLGSIPADFAGEVAVTDAEINAYLAENPQELAPIDSAIVHFVPGMITADFTAYGMRGTAQAQMGVENGRIVAVNPTISGPLQYVLSPSDLASAMEDEVNRQITEDGKQVTSIVVESGLLRAMIEPR